MGEWVPMLVMPNLDIRGSIECEFAAIVSATDSRVEKIRRYHPNVTNFLGKFSGQFKNQCWPSLLILSADSPEMCRTAEAITAFRDLASLSAIPLARAKRLRFDRGESLVYSTAFQFYPWTLDKHYKNLIMSNPASTSMHLVSEFNGQSFPEQSQVSLMEQYVDLPLAKALLKRWVMRFPRNSTSRCDLVLFRSLSMANEAARIPALVAPTFYDVGRTLALWVSAFEILAHPGATGQSNFTTVAALIEKVKWLDCALSAKTHNVVIGKKSELRPLATSIYKKIYDLRNDYLHGNDADGSSLVLNNNKGIIDFAACLYRFALTGFLGLKFNEPRPLVDDVDATGNFMSRRRDFHEPQESLEAAVLTAI